ncbi:actin-like protein [Plasmodium gonderi]|uniref:Actin-like protein n=1 Tax=Plasmodium gonderi TaxID=77519 RepID=A0A1Y1JHD7_PLAGO|nr:actin-like protein [Plasmodium gonderi]GAW80172.1 actin-like protein [Plasmodium gonderi]
MNKREEGINTPIQSPITESLYLKLRDPLGPHVNLNNSVTSSEKKKKLHKRISFSSFSNTTCSDIIKLSNYLPIENNIVLLTLGNYSFKVGLVNKYDCKLQSLRLPQMEIIEPWRELGYLYPPYKNYEIIEESIYHCFSNIYKINLKNKDLFIPFSSKNSMQDFSTLGDILFDTFKVQSVAFKEPSFVSSLIILEHLLQEQKNKQHTYQVMFYRDGEKDTVACNENLSDTTSGRRHSLSNCEEGCKNDKEDFSMLQIKSNIPSSPCKKTKTIERKRKRTGKEEYPMECLTKLKELNFFNFTAILVNIGSTKTTCTPVINGIPLPDLSNIYYIGGYDIDNQIFDEMKRNEKYQKDVSLESAKIAKEKRVLTPKTREECGYLSLLYDKAPKNYLVNSFELHFNKIFASAVNSTEIFFSPYHLGNYLKTESYKKLHTYDINVTYYSTEATPSLNSSLSYIFTQNTLPCVIYDTIQKCPIDTRRELFKNIYLIGGSSIIRGFRERLQNELYDFVKNKNFYINISINVHVVRWTMLQKYAIYSGSHYFLELFDYYNYNITRADYEEYGENILERLSLQGKLLY